MSNHNRGLWGYSGETPEGRPLTIQSTGMGGPSAAIVLHELAELGVRRAIRVGTCGALDPALELGQLLRAEAALPEDGVSRGLGAEGPQPADPELLDRLEAAGAGDPRDRRDDGPLLRVHRSAQGRLGRGGRAPRSRWRPRRCSRWAPAWAWRSPACWS